MSRPNPARAHGVWHLVVAGAIALLGFACSSGDDGISRLPDGSLFTPDGSGVADDDGAVTEPTADASTCITQPCDLYEQCGCRSGQACDVDLSEPGENACREVTELGGIADTCTFTGCRPGLICVSDEPSFCRRHCRDDADCPGAGALCRINLTGHDVGLCDFHCNAARTDGDGCPEARPGCYFFRVEQGSPEHFTTCSAPGSSGSGGPCPSGQTDCLPGHTCLSFGGEQQCRRTCIIGEGGCPGETQCCPYPGIARVGEREYGFCGPQSECPTN